MLPEIRVAKMVLRGTIAEVGIQGGCAGAAEELWMSNAARDGWKIRVTRMVRMGPGLYDQLGLWMSF